MAIDRASTPPESMVPSLEHIRPGLDRVVVAEDGDSSIVGRPDLNLFFAVPLPGGAFVTTLQQTGSIELATTRAEEVAGSPVDGVDFLRGLVATGLFDDATSELAVAGGGEARNQRSGVYLAGMAVDSLLLFLALALQWAALNQWGPVAPGLAGFLGAVAFTLVVGIGQQWALVFLRSDVYALLANVLGCHNLYRATWLAAKSRLWRLTDEDREELASISEHDRRVGRWFGLVYVVGCLMVGAFLIWWVFPFLAGMVRWLVPVVSAGDVGSAEFWTALTFSHIPSRCGSRPRCWH